MISERLIKK